MSEHTPGPWTVEPCSDPGPHDCRAWRVEAHDDYTVTISVSANPSDARLIAAAPDLLQALEVLVTRCQTDDVPWREEIDARIAIAKARGERMQA